MAVAEPRRIMKWYFATALLLLAAILMGSSLLAYATYVLLGVLLGSRLLAWTWLDNIVVTRQCAAAVVEVDDEVLVIVTLRNTGAFPVPWVLVEDMLPAPALDERRCRRIKGKRSSRRSYVYPRRAGGDACATPSSACRNAVTIKSVR